MELKETVENLRLANDINMLSTEELANKYLSSSRRYSDFIKKYAEFFVYSPLYQLRAFKQYDKILELIDYGHVMYNIKGLDQLEKNILCQINRNVTNYRLNMLRDDEFQAKWVLEESIGKHKVNNEESYEEVVKGMYDAADRYSKRKITHSEIMDSLYCINALVTGKDKEEMFKRVCEKYPNLKNCNNIDFLYFANYMVRLKPSVVDDEFIEDIFNVIDESEFIFKNGFDDGSTNRRDYKKLAKATLKNVKAYEKKKAKSLKK